MFLRNVLKVVLGFCQTQIDCSGVCWLCFVQKLYRTEMYIVQNSSISFHVIFSILFLEHQLTRNVSSWNLTCGASLDLLAINFVTKLREIHNATVARRNLKQNLTLTMSAHFSKCLRSWKHNYFFIFTGINVIRIIADLICVYYSFMTPCP